MRGRPFFAIALFLSLLIPSVATGLHPAPRAVAAPLVSAHARVSQQADGTTVIEAADRPFDPTPKGEQALTLGFPISYVETDPAFVKELSNAFLNRQIFAGLVRFDETLSPIPALASRIEISSDGLEYRFTLSERALFHDGSSITADDVVFSLTRASNPATAGGEIAYLSGPTFLSDIDGFAALLSGESQNLSGLTALDERTVLIRLSRPRATFLMKLCSAAGSVVDREQVERDVDWWRQPNGSGPFTIGEWRENELMRLERVRGPEVGGPVLERIDLLLGQAAQNGFNLYQAGEIDMVDDVGPYNVDRVLAPESGYLDQLRVTPLLSVEYLAFRTDTAPMDDPEIRLALQLAFPRQKVAEVSFDGRVQEATGMIPNGTLGVAWEGNLPGYDPEAAKAAIARSRYGAAENVPPIEIYVSGDSAATSLRDSVRDAVGLRIEVINVSWPSFIAGLGSRAFPGYGLYWGADYPDPESFLTTLFGSGQPDNYVDYSNPAMDDVLARAAVETDVARRIELYAEAQQLLLDDHAVIPVTFDQSYGLVRNDVKGLVITPMGLLALDRVWMEQ